MCSCSLQKMLKSFYAFDSLERPHSYIHTGQAPQYLSNCISTISSSGNRYRLRSCDTADYILPRTRTKFGERGFHYSGPAAWNTLPSDLHDITDTNVFKKRLKTVLFDRAYTDLLSSSFITPEGSKISHKNTKIHKITHTKYDTKLHISTHIHTVKQ